VSRKGIYNQSLVTEDKWERVLPENKELLEDFLMYKRASDKSKQTLYQYERMLKIFFVWNVSNNANLCFVKLRKKGLIKFIYYMTSELKYSSNRIATMKSALSSMGNYIENILSEEYPNYRNQVRGLESPAKAMVREKTVLTEELVQEALDSLVSKGLYQTACYLACSLASGARKAEVLQFKLSDFKDDKRVFDGCMWKTSPIRTKGRGSAGKVLQKFVFVNQLKPYLDLWLEYRTQVGIDSEWLFVSDGHQATINNANTWSETISRHMPVDFYTHACRHYWTTNLKKQKLPDDVIIALMGWEKGSGSAMVAIYNDVNIEDTLGEYFDQNGIKIIE